MNPLKIKKNQLIYQSSATESRTLDKVFVSLVLYLILASTIALVLNQHYFHFKGYPYFEFTFIIYVFFIGFVRYIIKDLLDNQALEPKITDFLLAFTTMVLIGYFTTAVQLTPFPVIDSLLGQYEPLPFVQTHQWTNRHSVIEYLLSINYELLTNSLIYIPIIVILMGYRQSVHHYCRFMLLSSAIGFTLYYFFPSSGPASFYPQNMFLSVQHANHIKFWLIHHGQKPLTPDGGLIALPSFHVIWAWACCRLFAEAPKPIYYASFSFFILTVLGCFCLGWHYSIDIFASFVIICMTEKVLSYNLK